MVFTLPHTAFVNYFNKHDFNQIKEQANINDAVAV